MVTGKLIPISKDWMWPLCIVDITYSLQTTNLIFDEKTLELYKEREFQYLYVWKKDILSYKPQVSEVIPDNSDGKESSCNAGDPGSISGSGRFPGEGNSYPLQHSCLENSMDRRAWRAIVHGVAKSWTLLKQLNTFQKARAGTIKVSNSKRSGGDVFWSLESSPKGLDYKASEAGK